ncbi:MAG: DUF3833 family protein [Burkholderiales bacterium]
MRTMLLSCLALPLAACIVTPEHADLARAEPVFSPAGFFSGRTHGQATLKILLSGSTPVQVVGEGTVEPDGTLVLVQRIERGSESPATRTWRIHPAGDGRYGGTLTSAEGPVTGDVSGNRLHLRFTAEGGLDTEQWLYLQPGGQVALNRMVVRKFGLPVAALEETIGKE